MIPKGKLLIIGGAEDRADDSTPEMAKKNATADRFEILKELTSAKPSGNIEIITTGSRVPEEIKKMYEKTFKKIGYKKIGFINIGNKLEAKNEEFTEKIKSAKAVLFTGGDQFRISTILGGTKIAKAIHQKYMEDKNFIVAGTSAGAMVMAKIMINRGGISEALLNSDLSIASGLGLLNQCIIDTHFIKRGRFGRLAQAVIGNPGLLGVGLGEDTALIISNGTESECRGSGTVVIIDGSDIRQTNITEAGDDCPIFVENLRVHMLVKGCRFSFRTKRLANPAIAPSTKK
jgi:cyanophycinase